MKIIPILLEKGDLFMYGGVEQRVLGVNNGRITYVAASSNSVGRPNSFSEMSVNSKEKIWLLVNKRLAKDFIIHPSKELNHSQTYQLVS